MPPTKSYLIATTEKAHNFKREWQRGTVHLGGGGALSEREPTAYLLFGLLSACVLHSLKGMSRVTKLLNLLDDKTTPCITGMAVRSFLPLASRSGGGGDSAPHTQKRT